MTAFGYARGQCVRARSTARPRDVKPARVPQSVTDVGLPRAHIWAADATKSRAEIPMTERKQSIQDYSRRELIGSGVATGVVLSLADRARAQSSTSTAEKASSMALQDPTTKYLSPPFKPQEQPWPGAPSRSRRDKLSRLWPAQRAQGAHHRWRFWHGSRSGDCLRS